jgi:hypothetical protein
LVLSLHAKVSSSVFGRSDSIETRSTLTKFHYLGHFTTSGCGLVSRWIKSCRYCSPSTKSRVVGLKGLHLASQLPETVIPVAKKTLHMVARDEACGLGVAEEAFH